MATITATSTNNWATAFPSVPTAADDVVIPSPFTVTIPAAYTALARSFTVSNGGGLTFAATTSLLNIGDATVGLGNIAMSIGSTATITNTAQGVITFKSTSTTQQSINTGGKTLPGVTVDGVGSSYLMASTLTCTTFTFNNGTFNTGSFAMTPTTFTSGAGTKTLTLGSSSISCNSWSMRTLGTTITANNATITQSSTTPQFDVSATSGNNYGGLTLFQSGSGNAQVGTTSTPTITVGTYNRTGTAAKTDSLTLGCNLTVTGTCTINGNSSINRVLVQSLTVGTAVTITAATVSTSNSDWMDITAAGAANWNLSAITGNSGDCQGNTGITFTTAATQTFTSGTKSWSDVTVWTSRVPLPQDDVIVNTTTATTLTIDMPRMGKNVNFTGFNKTATNNTAANVYGSFTLASGMTWSMNNTQTMTLRGRGSYTVTGAGKTWSISNNGGLAITAPGGTYTAQDALILSSVTTSSPSGSLTLNNGTFVDGGYSHTFTSVSITGTATRTLTKTGNWFIITTAAATIWNATNTTGLTFSDSGTTTISNASVSSRTWAGGGLTYGTLTYTVAGSTGSLVISGSNYFDTLNFSDATNARTLSLTASVVQTVKNFNVIGTSGKLMTVNSTTGGTQAQLALYGPVDTVDFLSVQDINSSLPYKFYAGANSTNVSGNTNVIFTAPVTQLYVTWSSDIAQINTAGNTTMSVTPSYGHTATAGTLLIFAVTLGSANPGAITSAPTGYTQVDNNSATGAAYTYIYYKIAAGGETTASISWTNGITNVSCRLTEIAGWVGTPTLDVKDKNNSGASSVTTLSTGSGVSNTAQPAFAYAYFSGNSTLSTLVSITNNYQEERLQLVANTTGGRSFGLPLTSTGSQTTTFTWTTSRTASAQLVIFKDASGHTLSMLGVGS